MSNRPKQVLTVEMADGTEHEVIIVNADRVAFDKAAMLNDWAYPSNDNPRGALLMQSYLAWHRLQKLGLYPGPFATFNDDAVDIESSKHTDPTTVDPTPPDQSPAG